MENIVGLGEMGKESLFLYVSENIGELLIRLPELTIQTKEIGSIFKNKGGKK